MEIEKIVPKDGPTIDEFKKYIDKYKDQLIVIKYGGNVFIDRNIFNNFISDISILNKLGLSIIIVHGGGPRIKRELDKSNIQSKFIRGLRVTDDKTIDIVESVLIDFNDDIVSSLKKFPTSCIPIGSLSEVSPAGIFKVGSPARLIGVVKISERYISRGFSRFSPCLNAGVGVVGRRMISISLNTLTKSFRISLLTC